MLAQPPEELRFVRYRLYVLWLLWSDGSVSNDWSVIGPAPENLKFSLLSAVQSISSHHTRLVSGSYQARAATVY